jgi:hypothetical protein
MGFVKTEAYKLTSKYFVSGLEMEVRKKYSSACSNGRYVKEYCPISEFNFDFMKSSYVYRLAFYANIISIIDLIFYLLFMNHLIGEHNVLRQE